MVSYNYYLGPWVWDTSDPTEPFWRAPNGTVGSVDLRSLPDQALQGTPGVRPHGFFAVNGSLGSSEYALLGNGDLRDMILTTPMKSAWQSLIGYTPQGAMLVDGLFDQLTTGADVSGDTPTMPLVPTLQGNLEIQLGGHSIVKTERFRLGKHPHTVKIRDLLRRQYARAKGDVDRGKMRPDQDRRILDYWLDKYKIDKSDPAAWKQLIPANMRRGHRGPLKHETTITESFDKPDSPTLGPDLTWTETSGNVDVVGNRTLASADGAQRAESDLSSSDHYAQLEIPTTPGEAHGPSTRFSASAETYYHFRTWSAGGGLYRLFKSVAGSWTTLDTLIEAPVKPFVARLSCSGSTITCLADGASKISVTDTGITGNVRCGMYHRTNNIADLFEAADLAIGVAIPIAAHHYQQLAN